MTTEHTPGPWEARLLYRAEAAEFEDITRGFVDAWWVEHGGWLDEGEFLLMSEGDARLIAAAPDLLQALENLILIGAAFSAGSEEPWRSALAAIAKAKGQS